ncbi:hypothetical protein C8A00DRAFT_11974 [Chaetomidium leptoderma]|uniref:C2H2-type domain-containing protein n=1 Tax=Chaetomidium leptoderma TaxID=669021 RepID=A0AAN6VVA0_9PEZI|nr:hypothetical protein C8A00DRAFT_11974 [Chaetomidium leptoderma]
MDEPTRHHSYSSTADTVLDLRVLDDDENGQKDPEDPEAVKPFYSPPSHPVSEHPYQQGVTEHVPSPPTFGSPSSPRLSEFPRQQSIAKNDPPSPLKKRKARQQHQQQQQQQQEPVGCQPCNFFPKAAGQRRKMDKHNRTNKHRKRTGQDVGACEPFPCLICKTKFSREDNLFQHLRKAHGVQQHQGGKKLAWKEVGRSLALSGALAGQGEGGWF